MKTSLKMNRTVTYRFSHMALQKKNCERKIICQTKMKI